MENSNIFRLYPAKPKVRETISGVVSYPLNVGSVATIHTEDGRTIMTGRITTIKAVTESEIHFETRERFYMVVRPTPYAA
jgi:hypothetical protein